MSFGRNEPCPCGSGKKYKHCCQGEVTTRGGPAAAGSSPGLASSRELAALKRSANERFATERFREAIAPLREIVRLKPDGADCRYDLGAAYLRCGLYVEAAESLRKAVDLRPGFHQALGQLAYALERLQYDAEAAVQYRKLSRNATAPRQRLFHLAKAQILEGTLPEAEATLRRLLTLAPNDGEIRTLLGQVLVDQRKFEEAGEELRRATETVPAAFHKLATTRHMAEADRPLLERMRAKAAEPGLDLEERTLIHFGLGKACDDLGEFEEAMRQYDTANALRGRAARFDRAALARDYDDIIARYNADALDRAARATLRVGRLGRDLPVFIVGLPRSGTTLTEQILSSHPAVAAAGEQPFWGIRARKMLYGPDGLPDPDALSGIADEYIGLLRRFGPSASRVTDKAPLNFATLGVLRLALPDARIIHCRRHPLDTCLSIYFTDFSSSLGFAFDKGHIAFMHRQYERLMAHWRRVLPANRFIELDYENLIADSEAEIRRLVDFLGLAWDDACLAHERNTRVVRTASVWQARQPIYKTSLERWRRYEPWLGEMRELLPNSQGGFGLPAMTQPN